MTGGDSSSSVAGKRTRLCLAERLKSFMSLVTFQKPGLSAYTGFRVSVS